MRKKSVKTENTDKTVDTNKVKKSSKKAILVVKDSVPAVVSTPATESKPRNNLISNLLTSKSKAINKKHTLYVDVSPDKFFVLCDGRKIKNAKELADLLQLINDDMFKYHVTDTKNDFSNWINDVFGESELSKKIRTSRNRLDMSIEIYREMFDKIKK